MSRIWENYNRNHSFYHDLKTTGAGISKVRHGFNKMDKVLKTIGGDFAKDIGNILGLGELRTIFDLSDVVQSELEPFINNKLRDKLQGGPHGSIINHPTLSHPNHIHPQGLPIIDNAYLVRGGSQNRQASAHSVISKGASVS
jgi:hypothetical protein